MEPSILLSISPIYQAIIATCFTWLITAAGAALVFLFKSVNKKVMDGMLGFAAGVMIAASFWSLLAPAIELSKKASMLPWLAPLLGFIAGGVLLYFADALITKFTHKKEEEDETKVNGWKENWMLLIAITLHNIPEGLAIGVAFGAIAVGGSAGDIASAYALAVGIGIQNFPEGAAVSLPLRRSGLSRFRSFWYGQLSGVVEPMAGALGVIAVMSMKNLLPYALAFGAGAMIYVVVEELIPQAHGERKSSIVTTGTMIGFAVMMLLDVSLG